MKSFLSTQKTSVTEELGLQGLKLHHEYLKEIYPVFLPNHIFKLTGPQRDFIKLYNDGDVLS